MSAPVKNASAPAQSGSGAQKLGPPILVYIAAALVAGIVGAVISVEFLGESLAALGVPDPGTATTFGLPFLRSAATLIGCMGIGGFLMSAFGAPPRKDGYLDYDGYAAARTGQWGMFLWAVCSLILIPMYMSDVSGSPLKETLKPDLWGVAIQQVSTAKAFLAVAIIAGLTWFFSLLTRKWIWQPVFLALALCTMIPLALEGHSASGGNHDYGVNSTYAQQCYDFPPLALWREFPAVARDGHRGVGGWPDGPGRARETPRTAPGADHEAL